MTPPLSRFPLVQLRHLSAVPIINGLGEAGDPAHHAAWPRYIRTTDIATVRALDDNKRVTLPPELADEARVLRGDILMTSAGTVGKSYLHLTDEIACFAGYLSRLRVRSDRALPEFVAYWTESSHYTDQVQSGAVKSTIENFSAAKYRAMRMPVPTLQEQRAIADYLDRETAQIDAFIAKNEELITLLAERRSAVIALAIRQGARATASLGLLLRGLKDGTHGSFARVESSHALLGARNVQGGQLLLDGQESCISEADHLSIIANGFPRLGDVLLVIVGATIGKSAVYNRHESLSFQRSVAFLRPGHLLDSKFLWYYTQTRAFQDEVWLRAKVSAQPGLYLGDVASIPITLPDIASQRDITDELDRDVAAIDGAIAVGKTAMRLARERRAALISAAVTGRIDVGVAV